MDIAEVVETLSPNRIGEAYLHACRLELEAFKPGNVSLHAGGHGMDAEDFLTSAQVSAEPLTQSGAGLGERIFRAVGATRRAVGCNTNLGILLLCGPLVHASLGRPVNFNLRAGLRRTLRETSLTDSEWVYRAIRLAAPGGLGRSPAHDIAQPPHVSLRDAMQTAAHRDRIAAQFSNDYADVFDYAVPRFLAFYTRWADETRATLGVYLGLLAQFPDSHVARKLGLTVAREVSARVASLAREMEQGQSHEKLRGRLREVDEQFKVSGINPGTTADLTVATILAVRLGAFSDSAQVHDSTHALGPIKVN